MFSNVFLSKVVKKNGLVDKELKTMLGKKGENTFLIFSAFFTFLMTNTVKPVLETTCIKRPPALRDHLSDTATLLKST